MSDVTEMTIDELAHAAAMTVRNVRAHQSRGLLPAPEIKGRTGYYGPEHLARLELIKELQAEGLNLEAIRRIIEGAPERSSAELLDFTRAITEPFSEEHSEIVDAAELAAPWGDEADARFLAKAERLGIVRALGDGRFEMRSPRLHEAAKEIAALGVPIETALGMLERIKRSSDSVARAFVELFLEHVWRPFQDAGAPTDEYPRVRETLDRLRPLATQSLVAVFQLAMADVTESALERELGRLAEGGGGTRRGGGQRRRRR